jgi:4-hydroxy-tetrahydrodipicolinate reductase
VSTTAAVKSPVRIGLLGPNGRMGKQVIALLSSEFQNRAELTALVGKDHSTDGLLACDVVIDFSNPGAVVNLASKIQAKAGGPALVVASTGWTLDQRKVLEAASQFVPMVISSNFSLGVLAFMEILKVASPLLDSLGYLPVIEETHHRHKKDAPSGTALSLQRIISPMAPGGVQTHSVRAGEIVGDHQVSFHGTSDVIRIEHSAQNRDIFARGAIEAALWIVSARTRSENPVAHGMIPAETFFSDFKATQASV